MNIKTAFSLLAGAGVSAAALYLAFRRVPFTELIHYFKSIEYGWLLLSGLIGSSCFILRTYRWRIILESHRKIGFWSAFHPLMIGFMLNCILPGRVGEAARPLVLKKKENLPFTVGLATVAVERLMDLGMIIVLSAIVLYTVKIAPDFSISFGDYQLSPALLALAGKSLLRLCLVLFTGILLITIPGSRRLIKRIILRAPVLFFFAGDALKARIRGFLTSVVGVIDLFAAGFSLLRDPKKILACTLLTILIWGVTAYSYFIMAQGCPGMTLSYLELTTVMVIICVFIALPSVPGFWGIWEAGGVFALSLFGVSMKTAAGFTLANHALQIFPVIIVGLISAMVASVDVFKITGDRSGA